MNNKNATRTITANEVEVGMTVKAVNGKPMQMRVTGTQLISIADVVFLTGPKTVRRLNRYDLVKVVA